MIDLPLLGLVHPIALAFGGIVLLLASYYFAELGYRGLIDIITNESDDSYLSRMFSGMICVGLIGSAFSLMVVVLEIWGIVRIV